MKLVGIFKGDFRILEDLQPEQLDELSPDFAWLDIDSLDTKTQMLAKKRFNIDSLEEFGFPTIIAGEKYDIISLNYYHERLKREVVVFVFDKYILTVHGGKDAACDETMASVNEMLVSGGFDAENVLLGLFGTIIERHEAQLDLVRQSLMSLTTQLKKGTDNLSYLTQLNNDTSELSRVFYETKSQIADMIEGHVKIRGVGDTKDFLYLYSKMNILLRYANDFSSTVEEYSNIMLSAAWSDLSKTKSVAMGVSSLSVFLAVAAIVYVMFPDGLLGIPPLFMLLGFVILGALAFFLAQRKSSLQI